MSFFKKLVKISRPHLWLYTMGPYSFGVLAASTQGNEIIWSWFLIALILFSVPINLFIYGFNDYFDATTDLCNPKKHQLEYRAHESEKDLIVFALLGVLICLPLYIISTYQVKILFLLWFFLIITYNVPPFRFKALPFLDLLLSFNYPLLGIIGYVMVANQLPPIQTFIPIILLSISFHVYSAIHDMPYDKASGVMTTAIWFKTAEHSLLFCIICSLIASVSFMFSNWWMLSLTVLMYPLFFFIHYIRVPNHVDNSLQYYKIFLRLQYILGFIAVTFSLYYLGFF